MALYANQTYQFKPGDAVRCINPRGYEHDGFRERDLYTVKAVEGTYLRFAPLFGARKSDVVMYAHRFEPVDVAAAAKMPQNQRGSGADFKRGDMVKCVNAKGLKVGENKTYPLTEGHVYEVWGLTKDGLVIPVGFGMQGYLPSRFVLETPMQTKPQVPRRPFKAGDIVVCVDNRGSDYHRWFPPGKQFSVLRAEVWEEGPRKMPNGSLREIRQMLFFDHCPSGAYDARFDLVDVERALAGTKGSLDEYGPAPEKHNPIFDAIGKRFPTHPSDVLVHLDELKK